ncbi:MAG: hypothetical protein AAF789_06910 [Bacteroidota bacterium]
MKYISAAITLYFSIAVVQAQFEKAMGSSIPVIFSSQTSEELQVVVNKMIRIGEAEKTRWEPFYYSSYGYIKMAGYEKENEDKDAFFELALAQANKGLQVDPANSELVSLKGYVYMLQLTLDPANRAMTYSGKAFQEFNKAVNLDPKNPRAHYLLGRMQHGTAQFMGSGSEEACKSMATAKALFASEAKPSNPFAPTWGEKINLQSIEQICEGK